MKNLILLCFILVLSNLRADFSDYDLGQGRYSITYVELEETSHQDAKHYALTHAAEIAHQNGYRYFTLDSEENVVVTQSQESVEGPYNYNLFQEDIIEGQFGRGSIERRSTPEASIDTYNALRITITGYKKKPSKGNVFDVCNLIDCR